MRKLDPPAIYALEQPPPYDPWSIYGEFLMAAAKGDAPLVFDNAAEIPPRIKRTTDLTFKEINGGAICLDIFQAADDDTPRPLVIYIHGGYWKAGSQKAHGQHGIEFVDMGYTMASVDYRLSGEAPFPAAVLDIRDAIRWLCDHASEYAINPDRITLCGSSAGGHLSAFMGLAAQDRSRQYCDGFDPGIIKAVISLSGIHDLTLPFHHDHPFTTQFIGATYAEDSARYIEASPVTHVSSNSPPVLLMHGTLDGSVPVKHSDLLAQRLEEAKVPVMYDRIDGWAHCMQWFSPIAERTLWRTYHFLRQYAPSDFMLA